jgi:hypothetical protein
MWHYAYLLHIRQLVRHPAASAALATACRLLSGFTISFWNGEQLLAEKKQRQLQQQSQQRWQIGASRLVCSFVTFTTLLHTAC